MSDRPCSTSPHWRMEAEAKQEKKHNPTQGPGRMAQMPQSSMDYSVARLCRDRWSTRITITEIFSRLKSSCTWLSPPTNNRGLLQPRRDLNVNQNLSAVTSGSYTCADMMIWHLCWYDDLTDFGLLGTTLLIWNDMHIQLNPPLSRILHELTGRRQNEVE